MNTFDRPRSEIIRNMPDGSAAFQHYQMDFSLRGKKARHTPPVMPALSDEVVATELEEVPSLWWPEPDFEDAQNEALIEHILTHYQEAQRWQLPESIR